MKRLKGAVLCLITAMVGSVAAMPLCAQEISKIRVGSLASNTSTTTANSFYPSSTVSTREIWGPNPSANRPSELKELARALRGSVDLIYEYVHDNVSTEFMYGLKKGALGAAIDQSGTPFDQAHLMVELLREAGYSARYKAGTIQLNATQMNAWLGSSNTTAVQQILRNGGIPLNYSSSGPIYTIGHIWVEVTIPGASCGSTCWFDPSYKAHTFKPTLPSLETLMGWTANEFSTANSAGFLGQAWSTLQQQATPAVPVWVSNVNYDTSPSAGVRYKLQTYATNLANQLQTTTYSGYEIEDVVGGQEINKTGSAAVRNTASLPGFTTSVQRTWDCSSDTTCGIPDAYRTLLTLKLLDQTNPTTNPPLMSKTLFVDEIYGRRLYFDLPMALSLPDEGDVTFPTLEPWCVKLTLDGTPVVGGAVGCSGQTTPVPNQRVHLVRMEVNSPYAAGSPAGSYMDLSAATNTHIDKRVDFGLPVVVVHGWGETSAALLSKVSAEQSNDRMLPAVDQYNPEAPEPSSSRGNSAMDHTMTKLGLSYLAQYGTMANLQKRLGGAEHQLHYTVGLVHGVAMIQNTFPPPQQSSTTLDWNVVDRSIRINIDSAISVTSKTNIAADRRRVIQSTLAAASVIEGSIYEQNLDQLYVGSTATRFHWGNANLNNRYYLYTTLPSQTDYQNLYSTTLGCAQSAPVAADYGSLSSYVNVTEGFWAIAAAERCLGPGNKYSTAKVSPTQHRPAKERGAAFVAWRADDAAVAHVITYYDYTHNVAFKGGGAAVRPEYEREFDPTGAAGLLKDQFEDRSSLHGVNLQTGEINYSPAADISIGDGTFPYEPTFQRTFSAGSAGSPGLSNGWGHNLDIRAAISGDGFAKMGDTSAALAAETIAALYTMQKIYSVAPAPASNPTATQQRDHLKRWVLAPFVGHWWGTRLSNNVVTITQGRSTQQYSRHVDDTFKPPRNGVGTVAQSGQRVPELCTGCPSPPAPDDIKTQWNYAGVSFTYTSPTKEVQSFSYFEYNNNFNPFFGNSEKLAGEKHGWHLNNWAFPYGVSLSFGYEFPPPQSSTYGVDRLVTVSNNLDRSLTLAYTSTFDGTRLDSITDGQGRTVQFGYDTNGNVNPVTGTLATVTDAEGKIWRYHYIGAGFNMASVAAGSRWLADPKLWKAFTPSDTTYEKMRIDYDRTWRVKEYRDAVAVKTPAQRNPHQFYITGTNRGERLSPLHGQPDPHEWTVYYDRRGRAIQVLDEEDRVYSQLFDNKDRLKERLYPEGNKVRFTYDDPTQQIKSITQVAKSSTYWSGALADISVSATYDPACGKIKTVTDARGNVTTWNYNQSTCVLDNVQQPQAPDPQNGNVLTTPTTSFLYNGFGQVTQITDPTNRTVSFEYDPTTKYRLRRRVNPAGLNLITTYGRNAYGDISSVDGPRSDVVDVTFFQYDKMRRLTRVDAPLAQITRNCYDADGNVTGVHRNKSTSTAPPDPNCAATYDPNYWQSWSKTYTPTKKVEQEISPTLAITAHSYDPLDRLEVVADPEGRKVKTDYFRDGRTKRIIKAYQSPNMAAINYATYTLTANGQIDTVADGNGNLTNLDYDGHDRLHRTFFTDAAPAGVPCAPSLPHSAAAPTCTAGQLYEQLSYDPAGNATAKRNRSGLSLGFVFDALNRETSRTVPDNTAVPGDFSRTLTSRYDLAGRKWDLTADGQTITHAYDAAGRLDFVTDSYLGSSNLIDYGYDAAGNRTSLGFPSGGAVTYSFDALNRLDTVTEGGVQIADYEWDTLSRKDLVRQNNAALITDYGYEADDDLNALSLSTPSALNFTIGRNLASQITGLTASDGAYLSRPAATQSTAYEPNRLNQYSSAGGVAHGYDANGNLTSDGTYTFSYDEENRLRKAIGAGYTADYEYDPLGRRRAKIVNGVTTRFASDGAEEIEERDDSNVVLRRYVYGAEVDERLAMLAPACGTRCFYQVNWQGSTVKLINQANALAETYRYGPYGERIGWSPLDPDTGNPFRYTGRRFDPETGLYYYRARYYSPKVGRFLQTDPIDTQDDINLYAYALNDAVNRADPTGLESPCVGINGCRTFGQASPSEGAAFVADFTPGVSDIKAIAEAVQDPSAVNIIAAGVGLVPGVGDVASKALKTGAKVVESAADANRAASRAKGIPDSQIGPSGKPKGHTVQHSTTKSANEAAQKETPPGGRVRFDAHPQDGRKPHYQAEDAKGQNVKPVVHHCPPNKRC